MKLFYTFILLFIGLSFSHAQDQLSSVDPVYFKALKYRSIGPYRGGRVTTVAGISNQPYTFFMGTTGGGVWKTTDAGQSWQNISDGYITVGSIGAIAVAPSDDNVIYVGTGSVCPRGNISHGNGVYKSTDGGESWKHIGLPNAGLIGKIEIHPQNPDLLYVAVLGNIFGPNEERGVYRSKDGGESWEKVYYIDEKTGAVDMVMDPSNPRILYAGFWQAERKPWTFIDGGPEGGIYKSVDGGENWEKLRGGLPDGIVGRVGIAISPANPKRLWVIQEAQEETKGGIYRSEDGGKSWKRINRKHELRQRAWYYNHVFADPKDENTVFILNAGFYKSVDGGENFSRIRTPHGDNHALWINPHNTSIMVQGNDGGANVSFNGGKTWTTQYNQPTAEMYRLTVDNQFPYRVYGAQQDNSTISVPSNSPGGISPKQHWLDVGGGESGHIAVDPRNPDLVYAGNYIGQIDRTDLSKGHSRNIVSYPQMHDGVAPRDIRYRFQWNAPIRLSPHNPDILYHCSQYVHRSKDGGNSWEVISPDLTTNKDEYHDIPGKPVQHDHTGVELYTTIFAFEESPQEEGVLWAGTDDGRVHISRDAGGSWEEITPKNIPLEGTVNMIDLSAHDPARAFIAVYKYRENDFKPYIFRTNNYGKNWKLLTDDKNGIPEDHFVRVVREDPDRKGLLYAGTEYGMYISFDDGTSWQSFQLNLPHTPITDLAVYRKDLVVATQGRSFWVLDDLTPLHELAKESMDAKYHLFGIRDAYRTQMRGFRGGDTPEAASRGATIYMYVDEQEIDPVKLEILDETGKNVYTYYTEPDRDKNEQSLKLSNGLNKISWPLIGPRPLLQPNSFMSLAYTGGITMPPGTYQAKLSAGEFSSTKNFQVHKDPRWESSDEDLKAQYELTLKAMNLLNEAHEAIGKLRSIRDQITRLAKEAVKAGFDEKIKQKAEDLSKLLTEIEEALIQTKSESGQDPINYPPMLDDQIAYLYSTLNFQDAKPNEGAYERYKDLQKELATYTQQLESLMNTEVKAFSEMLEEAEVPRVILGKE